MRNGRATDVHGNKRIKRIIALIVCVIIAAALGATGILCFAGGNGVTVNPPEQGSVNQSANQDIAVTGAVVAYSYTASTLNSGDTKTFTRNTASTGLADDTAERSIKLTLPAGIYRLEIRGGQGGDGCSGAIDSVNIAGGQGGYSKGEVMLTATTTYYIYLGGRGRSGYGSGNPKIYGGYNGGGMCRGDTDSNGPAGGGGGASHIATTQRGVLSNYNSYRGEVLLVAGGGEIGRAHV